MSRMPEVYDVNGNPGRLNKKVARFQKVPVLSW
jgi:hypothetical protein